MEFWFFISVLPFSFALVFVFVLFLRFALPIYVPCVFALCAFVSVVASSVVQSYFSSLKWVTSLQGLSFALFQSFVHSSCIEEIFKILCFYFAFRLVLFVPKNKIKLLNIEDCCNKYEELSINGNLVLSMFFCSTFAGFENIVYFSYDPTFALKRLFGASLLHVLLSFFYLGIFSKNKIKVCCAILLPILLHGAYNFFALLDRGFFSSLVFALLIFLNISGFIKNKTK